MSGAGLPSRRSAADEFTHLVIEMTSRFALPRGVAALPFCAAGFGADGILLGAVLDLFNGLGCVCVCLFVCVCVCVCERERERVC